MSSVNGSDNSASRNQDEILRRKREEYSQKESELTKRHRNEMSRVNQQHYQELENVKKNHESQMQNLRDQARNVQSKRDHKYQGQMNKLREIHRKQMEDISTSSYDKINNLKSAKQAEISQLKEKQQRQVQQVEEQNKKNYLTAEAQFQKTIDANREAQKEAIAEQREKINARHNLERNSLSNSHKKSHSSLHKAYQDFREHSTAKIRDQEVRHFSDKQRMEDNVISQVRRERQAHNSSVDLMKEGFNESLAQQRDRFHRAENKRKEAADINQAHLKSSVGERINNQVRRLEQDKIDLENKNVLEAVKAKKQTKLQINNLTRDYQNKLENMQEQKEESVRQANLSNREDVMKIHDKGQKLMQRQSRYYLDERHLENSKNRQAINSIETTFASRIEQTNQNADQRVKNVVELETDKTQRLQKKYEEARQMLQETHHGEILELRENYMKDRDNVVNNLKAQMQKREIEHAERMRSMKNEYSKKINAYNDKTLKDKKSTDMQLRKTIDDMKRAQASQLEAQKMRYEGQLIETRESHSRELTALNKRHEEQLDQVLSTIRKS